MNFIKNNKSLFLYLLKFFAIFTVAYYGTIAVEGLASPGNRYSPFIDHYLDYPSWLRASLLWATKTLLSLFGYNTVIPDAYHIRIVNGKSIQLIYECLGIGVMSFWIAFVLANKDPWKKRISWLLAGMLLLWLINVGRISLLIVAVNNGKDKIFGLDNHTFFNICAYIAIFLMIFLYDRKIFSRQPVSGIKHQHS